MSGTRSEVATLAADPPIHFLKQPVRMRSEAVESLDDRPFEIFGDKSRFALEVRLAPGTVNGTEPEDCAGSWGEWRLWVANLNLSELRLDTQDGLVELHQVRWFLAPLFAWIVDNWMPLLHEGRLPSGCQTGDGRPRSARAAYLAMVESAGDDFERFRPWQCWASRHSLRSASEGGILPDVFVQRMEDDLEFSWGDRIQPGANAASFLVEDGVARASVDAVAESLQSALQWFLEQQQSNKAPWVQELRARWKEIGEEAAGLSALSWFLDSSPEPEALTEKFLRALEQLKQPPSLAISSKAWSGTLAPEVAMFGDLSPNISNDSAAILLGEYFNARTGGEDSSVLSDLVSEVPAWTSSSPWHNGYALALDVLDEIDPEPEASLTHIEGMLELLGVRVKDVNLGEQGPRGVALAGGGLQATILVNRNNVRNSPRGRRFTLAHELCHILFDRNRSRPLAHSSTPWASPSIEQRANAFAAMLLMPPARAKLQSYADMDELKQSVETLAEKLNVSRVALNRHLANIDEISAGELDLLLGIQSHDL